MIKTGFSENVTKRYKYWFLEWILDEKGQAAYFYGANLNMLYQYDLEKNRVKQIGAFPDMPIANQLFRGGVIHNTRLYFPPRMAAKMGIYDIEKKKFWTKDIYAEIEREKEKFLPNDTGYISVKYQEKKAFFVYRSTPFCVVMDLEDESISYITCKETGEASFLGVEYCILGDFFISPVVSQGKILLLNLKDETMEIRDLPIDSDDSCCSINMSDNGKLYLLSCKEPSVLSWDPWSKEMTKVASLPLDAIAYEHGYWIRCEGNSIHIFPGLDLQGKNGRAFIVDILTGYVTEESIFDKYRDYIKWSVISQKEKHVHVMTTPGQDIFFSDKLIFVEYDWRKRSISEWELPLPQGTEAADMSQAIKSYQELIRFQYVVNHDPFYIESEYLPLSGWLGGFKCYDMKGKDIEEKYSIGKDICEMLTGL